MEDDAQTALHVRGAGPVDRLVVDPGDLLEGVIGREHRIHMAGQDEPPFGLGPDAQHEMLAVRLFVFAALRGNRGDRSRFDQFDRARENRKGIGQHGGHAREPVDIAGSGVDGRPFLDRAEHRIGIDRIEQRLGSMIRFHWQLP